MLSTYAGGLFGFTGTLFLTGAVVLAEAANGFGFELYLKSTLAECVVSTETTGDFVPIETAMLPTFL